MGTPERAAPRFAPVYTMRWNCRVSIIKNLAPPLEHVPVGEEALGIYDLCSW